MFLQQTLEDGTEPSLKWGKDRLVSDEEDPDQEMFLPAPEVTKRPSGNFFSLRNWPVDEDDSDIEVMEVFDPMPISYVFLASANPAGQIHEDPPLASSEPAPAASKKRAATSAASSGPPKTTKRQKKSADKVASKPPTKAIVRRARKPRSL